MAFLSSIAHSPRTVEQYSSIAITSTKRCAKFVSVEHLAGTRGSVNSLGMIRRSWGLALDAWSRDKQVSRTEEGALNHNGIEQKALAGCPVSTIARLPVVHVSYSFYVVSK